MGAAGATGTGVGVGWPGVLGAGVGIIDGIIDGPKGVVLHCLRRANHGNHNLLRRLKLEWQGNIRAIRAHDVRARRRSTSPLGREASEAHQYHWDWR